MPIKNIYSSAGCEWIDVRSASADDLAFIQHKYNINPLLLEDTLDANHLPKYETDGEVQFFLMRENTRSERANLNTISDVSTKLGVFLTGSTIITIHRMRNASITEMKAEIADNRYPAITRDEIALQLALKVLKSFDEESQRLLTLMDEIETEVFLNKINKTDHIKRLYRLKRKAGLNARILSISHTWVDKFCQLKLEEAAVTDLKDKQRDVIGDFEHLTLQVSNLISMFLALSDQRANQVMKMLAIYSMYFFPITFIAGIYGMNFDAMPELHTKYGYYITLAVMGIISLITFLYVRRKGW